ncbi:MAG: type II toxin-antitoxin system RelE/ParE family toxin [Verrucomicrobiota bacterium]|nr:type II toxin-antitoxin system RelE/ParE family toxin [Verrucomicrobiota bacterium]
MAHVHEERFAAYSARRYHPHPCSRRAARQEPLPHGSEKLAGSDYTYRIRIGDYRVVYELLHRGGIVEIQRVRHQGCLSLTLHHRTNGNLIIFTDGSIVETNDVLPK